MTTIELMDWLRRQLGHPVVKVELTDQQILDNINKAVSRFIKYAPDTATSEDFSTVMLSGGQRTYQLPEGVVDVVSMEEADMQDGRGINTLFTIDNYLYSAGILNFQNMGSGFNLVNYHLALDFIETLDRYSGGTRYSYNFHPESGTLELNQAPPLGQWVMIEEKDPETGEIIYKKIDSPGWLLLKCIILRGSTLPGWTLEKSYEILYEEEWVKRYALAHCKIVLGMVRRKFESFASIGNTGINLDGSSLISEGKDELNDLEDMLKNEIQGSNVGFICTGIV